MLAREAVVERNANEAVVENDEVTATDALPAVPAVSAYDAVVEKLAVPAKDPEALT